MESFDLLIVGAGPVGCVVAERAATELGWRVLIVEKRDHIAGNCFDCLHESGVLIHRYGAHLFRTDNKKLVDYLSRFTGWIPGNYVVKSQVQGNLFPFPINLTTLEMFFNRSLSPEEGAELLERVREKIDRPANSEELVLSRVGRELYEAFYRGYTLKQWGRDPREIDASVCGRVPVRLNRTEGYMNAAYPIMPDQGFTRMFERMTAHPLIEIRLKTDFAEVRETIRPRKATLFCGPVDEYFGCRLGKLEWRSLRFDFREYEQEFRQPCLQINYPNEHEYTRSVEIKHVTGQKHPKTVVYFEYPEAQGEPFYPVPAPRNFELYRKYEQLCREETRTRRIHFAGRLATYRYINMDEAMESALSVFEEIRS